ncbi:phage terminase small subunit P27 family [Cereibacter sphaeroides]|jgi:P27 family predicted phage terminase small subunit|uniref:phage terminase small subunit P27 family n=1 Tax=Cereibacter sphaeroides TaxID=1063 RepID=UPI000066418C|nr:phage terminase, small subunit, putative, P27 family [Cereibacter sphaeroides ATCC 17029]
MPPRGRKPTPTNLKVIAGTDRADRRNDKEPKPKAVRLAAPAFLSEPARGEWARVVEDLYALGILSNVDRAALAAYCQAYGRWVQAEEALSRMAERDQVTRGLMIKTSNGNAIQNPLVGSANTAMRDMVKFAAEFGMTPSARSRVKADDGGKGEDPAARFFG